MRDRNGVRCEGTYADVVTAPLIESRSRGDPGKRRSLARKPIVRVLDIDVNGMFYDKRGKDLIIEMSQPLLHVSGFWATNLPNGKI